MEKKIVYAYLRLTTYMPIMPSSAGLFREPFTICVAS